MEIKTIEIYKVIEGGEYYPNTTLVLNGFYPELNTRDKMVRVDDVKMRIKSFISDDMYESDKQIIYDLLKYLELIDNE